MRTKIISQGLRKEVFNMRAKIISIFLTLATLILFFSVVPAQASTYLYDHFDNGVLDPAWTVSYQNASGWSYAESGTNLNVTGITAVMNNNWAIVNLKQSFEPVNDFHTDFDFSWDSGTSSNVQQFVRLYLYDSSNNSILMTGYNDGYYGSGSQYAKIIGSGSFNSGENSLPLSGSASIDILRTGDNIDILWNKSSILSGTSNAPINSAMLQFGYWPTSTFGGLSVGLVSAAPPSLSPPLRGALLTVPEPSTMLLLGSGLFGLFFLGKKRLFK